MAQVVEKMGMGESTIWAAIAKGEFPAPLKVGPRGRRWEESILDEYIATIRAGKKWSTKPPEPDDDIWALIAKLINEPTYISRSRDTLLRPDAALYGLDRGPVIDMDSKVKSAAAQKSRKPKLKRR